jgi:hypothetical protein
MLDAGNFVLASPAGVNLWQSFVQPTDRMLPTQDLNQGGQLIKLTRLGKVLSTCRFLDT